MGLTDRGAPGLTSSPGCHVLWGPPSASAAEAPQKAKDRLVSSLSLRPWPKATASWFRFGLGKDSRSGHPHKYLLQPGPVRNWEETRNSPRPATQMAAGGGEKGKGLRSVIADP